MSDGTYTAERDDQADMNAARLYEAETAFERVAGTVRAALTVLRVSEQSRRIIEADLSTIRNELALDAPRDRYDR